MRVLTSPATSESLREKRSTPQLQQNSSIEAYRMPTARRPLAFSIRPMSRELHPPATRGANVSWKGRGVDVLAAEVSMKYENGRCEDRMQVLCLDVSIVV